MNQLRDFTTKLLWRLGTFDLLRRTLTGRGRFVVMFHGIAEQRHAGLPLEVQPALTRRELDTVLGWLRERFALLTPAEFLGGTLPGVLLTFDDGLANNVTIALPVLEQHAAPAVFFVAVQHVVDPTDWLPASRKLARQGWPDGHADVVAHHFFDGMSMAQLQHCGDHPLITIGGHTWTHPFLTDCSDSELTRELVESRRYLSEISGQRVDLLAYPTGDYDQRVAQAVQQAGYRAAFAEFPRQGDMPQFEIPRVGLYQADSAYLSAKLSGLHQPALKQQYA